jgi:hypothetical protein
MKSLVLTAALAVLFGWAAEAQTYQDSSGTIVPGFVPIQPGVGPLFTSSNPGHVSGSFSASLGGFTPTPSYAQLSSNSTSSQRVAVPSGAVDVIYNTSANVAYCTYGNNSVTATTSNDVIQANSWVAFSVPSGATNIACISPSGTLTINVSGGSGLPTGSGGGGGGGGSGGTVTQGAGSSGNPWYFTPSSGATIGISGSLPGFASTPTVTANQGGSNWSQNIAEVNGAAINTGTGASGTGTFRVATSTDSPGGALANPSYANVLQYQATPATQNITATDSGVTCSTTNNQGSQSICTGATTANSTASFTFPNALSGIGFSVTGMTAAVSGGYLNSECSLDAGTVSASSAHWFLCTAHIAGQAAGNNPYQSQLTGNVVGATINVAGLEGWRLRNTGTVTGTATVTVTQSSANNVTEIKGLASSSATGSAVPAEAVLQGMNVGGTNTAVPGTTYGVDIDTNSSSELATLLSTGYGTFGQAYPNAGVANGAKGSGNINPLIQADTFAEISISTATTTQLVALVSGKSIYVTHWDVIAGGPGNIQLEYGTGTNCGTGTTAITGNYNLVAQAGLSVGGGLGSVFIVPAGNALCALTSAAVQMSGLVSYTQF